MPEFPRVILRNNKADAVRRFHPWIFSGAIKTLEPNVHDGDFVEVHTEKGEYLASGIYNSGNIAVKILSFQPVDDLDQLFLERVQSAYFLRKQIGLATSNQTNCYRLINAEGDGLPGLIVDWYNGTAVMQAYSVGMHEQRDRLVNALKTVYGSQLQAVYDKSGTVLHKSKAQAENQYLLGERTSGEVLEYGHRFVVDWEEGQKTGLFLDQRENRERLTHYVEDKKVLNTFCYSGGFSVYAIAAQARCVHSVDSSAKALEWTRQNVALNHLEAADHEIYAADVFDFLKTCDADYDVIVLDPPAFAKGLSARHQAVMAYKRLNAQAFAKVRSPGIVFTFSCSQVVPPDQFQGAVTAAAIESGRRIRVLDHLTQPADHPTSIYHPEGLYLKGLVLMVE